MLTVLRAPDRTLQAACDWLIVDGGGVPSPYGQYVWIERLEMSPGVNSRETIREVIADVAFRCPNVHTAFWRRTDKWPWKLHQYSAKRLMVRLQHRKEEVMV